MDSLRHPKLTKWTNQAFPNGAECGQRRQGHWLCQRCDPVLQIALGIPRTPPDNSREIRNTRFTSNVENEKISAYCQISRSNY